MNVKALLKEYFGTEDFKRVRKLARVRTAKVSEVKAKIAGFLRGDESLAAFAEGVKAAVEDQAPLEPGAPPVAVWGFGGPGTSLFIAALLKAAPEPKIEAELRRALAGIDTRDPSDRLRTFAAFVARAAKEANLGPETSLHVGYATCFLSFCWHALYDLEVPVFYGSSHRGVKALIAGGVLADPEYASRDLSERFRAFLRVTRGLLELVRKVSAQLNLWTVESFLEWAAPRFEVAAVGTASSMLQQVELGAMRAAGGTSSSFALPPPMGALALAGAPAGAMPAAAMPGVGTSSGYYRTLQQPPQQHPNHPAHMPPPQGHVGTGSGGYRMPPAAPAAPAPAAPAPAAAPGVTIGAGDGPSSVQDETHAAPRPRSAHAQSAMAGAPAPPAEGTREGTRPKVDTRKLAGKSDAKAADEASPAHEVRAAEDGKAAEEKAKALADVRAALEQARQDEAREKAEAETHAKSQEAALAAEMKVLGEVKAQEDARQKVHDDAQAEARLKADAPQAAAKADAVPLESPVSREEPMAPQGGPRAAERPAAEAAAPAAPLEAPLAPPPADVTARRLSPFAPSPTTRMTRPGAPVQSKDDAIAALVKETRFPEKLVRDLDALLERRGQVALEGPTGAGKTLLARRFATIFAGSGQRVRVVQFHPSFHYEDFIEGPALAGAAPAQGAPGSSGASGLVGLLGGTSHAPQGGVHGTNPGVLKAFAQRAARDPTQRYVMVLDDLGRANAVAVLGEVFSLLEFREQEVVLPYSREPFFLPKNLYFVATACATQDARGLADPALRRRFPFMHVEPSAEALRGWLEGNRPEMAWVADVFAELNRRLLKEAGPRALVGQSLFMQSNLDDAELERIFQYDIRPMIEASIDASKLARFELSALKKAAKA